MRRTTKFPMRCLCAVANDPTSSSIGPAPPRPQYDTLLYGEMSGGGKAEVLGSRTAKQANLYLLAEEVSLWNDCKLSGKRKKTY